MPPLSKTYVLGSDIGTGSCKTVLLDETATVIASASKDYPSYYRHPDWVEQNPEEWYEAFCVSTRAVMEKTAINPKAIEAVCIVGVTHNPVLLGKKGDLLRPSIHFWDQRSHEQVKEIKNKWGDEVQKRALNDVGVLWTWPQLLWVKQHEPEVWDKLTTLLFPKDYVRHRVAPSLLTDTVDPAGTLLYDAKSSNYLTDFVEDLDVAHSVLPEPHSPTDTVAYVSAQGAKETGLAEGTAVLTGTTDTAAEVVGAGAHKPGQAVVKLASVGRIMMVTEQPLDGAHRLNYPHVFKGLWYPGSVTKYGAGAYRWAKEALWPDLVDNAYEQMDEAARQVPAGSDGVLFHPHLLGEFAPQWNPELRASFLGLSIQHTRKHFTRAVLEGVAYQIRAALEDLESTGVSYASVSLIGGGAASPLWAQIMSDVLGKELKIPRYQSAAYGAGLLAGQAVKIFSNLVELIRFEHSLSHGKNKVLYDEGYRLYCTMAKFLDEHYRS